MKFSERFQNLWDGIALYPDRLVCAVVHLNDTYLIDEQPSRFLPGFPRLIATINALREHIVRETGEDRLVVVHSGDFLGPSRLGIKDHGAAMIDMLNRSTLRYFVAGNHEFDYGAKEFEKQLEKANFELVCCNVGAPKTIRRASGFSLWPSQDSPLVAFTGVVSEDVHSSFKDKDGSFTSWPFTNADDALKKFCIGTNKIPFHVVLSHATRDEDRAMRPALANCKKRTILLGGHDHHIEHLEDDDEPVLYKNRSNLQTVRVILLHAGTDTAMQQLWKSYQELKKKHRGAPPPHDADSVDDLLRPLHRCDAEVFRAWIEADAHADQRVGVSMFYFDTEYEHLIPKDALVRRLEGLPILYDRWSHVLKFDDFLPADPEAEKAVHSALGPQSGEDTVVCDFSEETSQKLDARDSQLRTRPTDFGVLVAECVRRQADADVAIVNSGACRCDNMLDPKVTRGMLLDNFLYDIPKDGNEPIMTLTLTTDEIETLLKHGRGRANTGAYPQVSGELSPSKSQHRVAISSYLLLDEGCTDRYVEAYAQRFNVSVEEARTKFHKLRTSQFRIVPAIEKHARDLTYADITPVAAQVQDANPPTPATQFINLAKDARKEFDRIHSKVPTNFDEWYSAQEEFLALFARGAPVPADSALAAAREVLSDFVYNTLMQFDCDWDALYEEIGVHEENFADQDQNYRVIFRAVVEGMGIPW